MGFPPPKRATSTAKNVTTTTQTRTTLPSCPTPSSVQGTRWPLYGFAFSALDSMACRPITIRMTSTLTKKTMEVGDEVEGCKGGRLQMCLTLRAAINFTRSHSSAHWEAVPDELDVCQQPSAQHMCSLKRQVGCWARCSHASRRAFPGTSILACAVGH
eukprot:2510685-Amphidinium_carterae.1